MKVKYVKCDRCGKYEGSRKVFDGHITARIFEKRWDEEHFRGITLDLCEACEDQLRDFLKVKEKKA